MRETTRCPRRLRRNTSDDDTADSLRNKHLTAAEACREATIVRAVQHPPPKDEERASERASEERPISEIPRHLFRAEPPDGGDPRLGFSSTRSLHLSPSSQAPVLLPLTLFLASPFIHGFSSSVQTALVSEVSKHLQMRPPQGPCQYFDAAPEIDLVWVWYILVAMAVSLLVISESSSKDISFWDWCSFFCRASLESVSLLLPSPVRLPSSWLARLASPR